MTVSKSVRRARALRRGEDERGFTLIDLLFAVGMIGLLATLAIPMLARARGSAHASSALSSLRVINTSQFSFAITCGQGFFAPDLPTLGTAPPHSSEPFLTGDLSTAASVVKGGYTVTVAATPLADAPEACNGLARGLTSTGYVSLADPLDPQESPRFFGGNADGVFYEHTSTLSGIMPESGAPLQGRLVQ